ncbi:hypothetical protein [Pantoea sp. At-9b]|uniref:hypothetical protein n=1 Tax=Pantoea sp. (strain At-9b) TaxID=592316 RepID=UPI0001B3FE31|nr:hypothetical protein [Pantoea sp. At-9b]ADU69278.1 hypothetical protein Pat9b_1962 [Pantoea sp. At-9b]
MDDETIALINELALVQTQEQLEAMNLKLTLDFLTKSQSLMVEQTRGKVLDWSDWFRNHHHRLENKFTLAVSTKGRPPMTIGAAVFSYDMRNQIVNIHMVEHFKRVAYDDPLTGRMGFVALNVAFIFARTVQATHIRVINPLEHAKAYYSYLTFEPLSGGSMEASLRSIQDKLVHLRGLAGLHDFESAED